MTYLEKAKLRFNTKYRITDSGCWEWTASATIVNPKVQTLAYGKFSYEGSTQYAHRISYRFFIGSIPEGYVIDHLCRNTLCVNPEHLEAVTQLENLQRAPKHIIHGDERHVHLNKLKGRFV
jgi:hypothetical protein